MKTGTKIITLDNGYHLWTNTQGEGDIHLLALHGGPGGNHEYWEDTAEQLKKQGLNVQVTMYDQLGSLYSDQPDYSDPENVKKFFHKRKSTLCTNVKITTTTTTNVTKTTCKS